ncbi:hypothetical protein D3C73_1114240 [compost metagenome]
MALILLADRKVRIFLTVLHEVGDFFIGQAALDRPQHEAGIDFGVQVHRFQHGFLGKDFILRHLGSVFGKISSETCCKIIGLGRCFRRAGSDFGLLVRHSLREIAGQGEVERLH